MSRDKILADIRAVLPEAVELPPSVDFGITYEDKIAKFSEMLISVGGTPKVVGSIEEANQVLQQEFADKPKLLSFCDGIDSKGTSPDVERIGHDYQDVDLVALKGHFGVAENAAIWVTEDLVDHPASLVLSQHLSIVIRADELIDNMHQAYAQITEAPRYGVFISGPSKTADIEQSLVLGAHGARSLIVFIITS